MSLYDTAITLCQKGFSLIPLGERNKYLKIPAIKTWRQYQAVPATLEQVSKWWQLKPMSNIGILTGQIIVIDADSDDAIKIVESCLPYTNAQVRTSRGKHFYYLNTENIKNQKIVNTKIDIKSFGGYVVSPHSIHESGAVYTPISPLDEWNIPPLSNNEFARLHQEAWTLSAFCDQADEGTRNNTCASLAGGYICQGYNIDEIVSFLTIWNEANPRPLPHSEILTTVSSVFRTRQSQVEENTAAEEPVEEYAPPKISPPPDFFPRGLIGDIGQYIINSSIYPQPALACAAAICLLGTLLGRKVQTNTGSRTNIYAICLADSGFGKEAPRKAIKDLLYLTKGIHLLGGEDLGSSQGMFKAIAKSPSCLFLSDEFGHKLQSITNPKAGSYEREIMTAFMKLYSSADTILMGRILADEEKSRQDIIQPNASLYATSTIDPFYRALSSEHVVDGYLNRMLVFKGTTRRPPPNDARILRPPVELVEQISSMIAWSTDDMIIEGNIPDVRSLNITQHVDLLREIQKEETIHLESKHRDRALWVRFSEHVQKIALIYTLSQDIHSIHVHEEAILWARDLVRWCFSNLSYDVDERISNSGVESDVKEALRCIRGAGPEGITGRDLSRIFRKWPLKQRNDILVQLMSEGNIKIIDRPGKTKPTKVYIPIY